jgi:hypothetical protein
MLPVEGHTLQHYAELAKQFVAGGHVEKVKNLVLDGYTAVQDASYFILPLSEHIHVLAADRQLKHIDYRQRHRFGRWRDAHPDVAPWVLLPDPVFAFGDPSETGQGMYRALGLDSKQKAFILTGDLHNYQRAEQGENLHIIAGGGGAFLHPTRVDHRLETLVEGGPVHKSWPSLEQCRVLLRQVPAKVALGRSGTLPHYIWASVVWPILFVPWDGAKPTPWVWGAFLLQAMILGFVHKLIGDHRKHDGRITLFAIAAGLLSASAGLLAYYAAYGLSGLSGLPLWALKPVTLFLAT